MNLTGNGVERKVGKGWRVGIKAGKKGQGNADRVSSANLRDGGHWQLVQVWYWNAMAESSQGQITRSSDPEASHTSS